MPTLILICAVLNVLFTILPLSRNKHWIIRSLDFPRVQLAVFSLVVLILTYTSTDIETLWKMIIALATALCLVWHLWWIMPYTPLWPKEVQFCREANREKQLSIITSNVRMPNRDSEALVNLVKKYDPDIVVTLETDLWWQDQLKVLEADMPYSVKCPLDNYYGMHLYSKLRLHDAEVEFLIEEGVPSIHVSIELRTGVRVQAHFLHPAPPSPTENTESAERDAELIAVAKRVAGSKQPVVVAGDLNDVAWSSTTRLFRKISGLLDPRIGRGMFSTFPVKFPLFRWPVDHLFHSGHFKLCAIRRLPGIGSDHFPLFATLLFSPEAGAAQKGIKAQAEDRRRANETISKEAGDSKAVPQPGGGPTA